MIYLDSNATTQIDPLVVETMLPFLTTHFANPSASYSSARIVKKAIATAREQVAALIDCEPDEIVFTSGGTESSNAAIASAVTLEMRRAHLVTVKTEHSAVLEFVRRWSDTGRPVTEVDVDRDGLVILSALRSATMPGKTTLVSVMWANNETGVIAPVAEALDIAHERGAMFHTDAVQAIGKIPVSMKKTAVDYLSLSGHKFHAPKGVGALFISRRVRFRPWSLGGGQEFGRRSGTENVAGIVAMGRAAELMRENLEREGETNVRAMRDAFEDRVFAELPDTVPHGSRMHRLGTTSNLCFPGVEGAGLLILLDERGIACSAGSACHTETLHSSQVLQAMGYDAEHARCSLRFSWSRMNTMEETLRAADVVIECVRKMRALGGEGGIKIV